MHEIRSYRRLIKSEDLVSFTVVEKETDLFVLAEKDLSMEAIKYILKYRTQLEKYMAKDPLFGTTFNPHQVPFNAPRIVKAMARAGKVVGVGPMATVAGAMAEFVGKDLLKHTRELIVENGGDIFLKSSKPKRIGIFAGHSPFSEKVAIEIEPQETPLGVCTSAGTVGPSVSFGTADAVVVLSKSVALADATATAIGNVVKSIDYIQDGLDFAQNIKGLKGVLIIKEDRMGIWGKIKIMRI